MTRPFEEYLLQVQKPARYTGGELNSVTKEKHADLIRYAFCFPDLYEVGMSHLGMKILYGLLNQQEDVWCERVFAPADDMVQLMQQQDIPLFGLESRDPIRTFDMVGFTLQYEMSFTSILQMLELAGIPLHAADRDENFPIVMAGGPCACNPEPLADFFDLFQLGDGEELMLDVVNLYRRHKHSGHFDKREFLKEAAQIEGVYVPSLYDVTYREDGTIAAVTPKDGAPATVRKRIVGNLDTMYAPTSFVVPFTDTVFDRGVVEVFRGCIRGCRFCQAGFIYRPVREKSPEVITEQGRALCENTGYEELSLLSLSTGDYTHIESLLDGLLSWCEPRKTNLAVPSLRVDGFSEEMAKRLNVLRRAGLTFAPEAGTQRLRDTINKNVTEDDIMTTADKAFSSGWTSVKLYFMMGLPTETLEDIEGIAQLGQRVVDRYYQNPNKPKGKSVSVSMSVACFVPKPFTPFQWEPQDTLEQLEQKQKHLVDSVTTRKINLKWHDAQTSFVEAVLARGDRRVGAALEAAYRAGAHLDAWSQNFDFDRWKTAFEQVGLDMEFYACRRRDYEEILPWDHLDYGVTKAFLMREHQRAQRAETTPHCRQQCSGCGAAHWKEGLCVENR